MLFLCKVISDKTQHSSAAISLLSGSLSPPTCLYSQHALASGQRPNHAKHIGSSTPTRNLKSPSPSSEVWVVVVFPFSLLSDLALSWVCRIFTTLKERLANSTSSPSSYSLIFVFRVYLMIQLKILQDLKLINYNLHFHHI